MQTQIHTICTSAGHIEFGFLARNGRTLYPLRGGAVKVGAVIDSRPASAADVAAALTPADGYNPASAAIMALCGVMKTKADVMRRAWVLARDYAARNGQRPSAMLSHALKTAWREFKEANAA